MVCKFEEMKLGIGVIRFSDNFEFSIWVHYLHTILIVFGFHCRLFMNFTVLFSLFRLTENSHVLQLLNLECKAQ